MSAEETSLSPIEIIDRMREILGPNGEHWIKGDLWADDGYCLLGAMGAAMGYAPEDLSEDALHDFGDREIVNALYEAARTITESERTSIMQFNDAVGTTFKDITRALDLAKEILARK